MSAPVRIQRRRARGWRMPENTVYVGRPTQWGNPYRDASPAKAVERYREYLAFWLGQAMVIDQLRGKNLACWCPLDQPCHADVLLALANAPAPKRRGA